MNAPADDVDLQRRRAGVCLHISSLPGRYGIGDIGSAAFEFIDLLDRCRLSVWQFLPIGPTGYANSPYQSLSTFAGNDMLIDVANLGELGLLANSEIAELEHLPDTHVDFGALLPVKTRLLHRAAARFGKVASATLLQEYDHFLTVHDPEWLHDYALFRALKTRHDEQPWLDWEPQLASRDAGAIVAFESTHQQQINAIKIIQFLFFRQWETLRQHARTRGIELFGDLPIYVSQDSADAWTHPELLEVDDAGHPLNVAGVPPDYFSDDGQLWGNPLFDWAAHRAEGYRWWTARVKAMLQLVDLLRIDHFRGFESYWSVSADAETARDGVWLPGPGDDLFNTMREQLGRLPIIAEDLGVITQEVEELRARQQFPGMRVLHFDVSNPEFNIDLVGVDRVCYTGTHDNDTTVGWFLGGNDGAEAEQNHELQGAVLRAIHGKHETIHTDMIKAAFSSPAFLAIVPLQDILGLGSEARMNTPGTTDDNWNWRLQQHQLTPMVCKQIANLVTLTKRGRQHG